MVKRKIPVRFQVQIAMTTITDFWDETLSSLVANYQHFGGTYCIDFYPEDGGTMFLQNGKFLPDYMVLHPRIY
jgi:hypothetical protein